MDDRKPAACPVEVVLAALSRMYSVAAAAAAAVVVVIPRPGGHFRQRFSLELLANWVVVKGRPPHPFVVLSRNHKGEKSPTLGWMTLWSGVKKKKIRYVAAAKLRDGI